jgi:septum formation protein
MILTNLKGKKIILASNSPRRRQLMEELGLKFEVKTKAEVSEEFPSHLTPEEVAVYLAEHKASEFNEEIDENAVVVTADTIVVFENQILNKPVDFDDAVRMLEMLSGQKHSVITGVCLRTKTKTNSFFSKTDVYFKKLDKTETDYYIYNFKPYDKAGAYGIQEWIGLVGIEKIEGSYFNVMGLPVDMIYDRLKKL